MKKQALLLTTANLTPISARGLSWSFPATSSNPWLSSAASLWPRNNDTKGLLLTMARFKHKKVTEQTVTRLLSHGQRQPPSRTISCQAHRTRDIFCFESELWFVQGWNHVCQLFSASQEGTGHAGRRYLNYFNQVKKGDCLLSSAAKRD